MFAQNTLVVLTGLDDEFYTGLILNKPLPSDQVQQAWESLHVFEQEVSVFASPQAVREQLKRSHVWFGVGGPVPRREEEWTPIHRQLGVEGATPLEGVGLAAGGDIEQLLALEMEAPLGMLLLYGEARWLAGQLERELDEGMWEVQADWRAYEWVWLPDLTKTLVVAHAS